MKIAGYSISVGRALTVLVGVASLLTFAAGFRMGQPLASAIVVAVWAMWLPPRPKSAE